MKKVVKIFFITFLLTFMVSCQSENREPVFIFTNENGNTLFTNNDLKSMKVINYLVSENYGRRGLYIEFKDKNKLEKITSENLHTTIEIYYKDQLITTQYISRIIKGQNLGFTEMEEEILEWFEQLLDTENK